MDSTSHRYLVISIMGPHAGESEKEIFERKMADIYGIGKTFWLIRSHRAKPAMVQQVSKQAEREGARCNCVFIEPSSHGGAVPALTSDSARRYSIDGKIWHPLPNGLSPVTGKIDGGAHALVFDQLELMQTAKQLDLWNYADFFRPDFPVKMFQGASTVCVVRKDMGNHGSRMVRNIRRVIAVARLREPFCVYLR